MAAWNRISSSSRAEDFYTFLQQHPRGLMAELAQFRLDQLASGRVLPSPGRRGLVSLPSGTRRFQVGDQMSYQATDLLKNQTRRYTHRVTAASDTRVEINGGDEVFDQMGGTLFNRFGARQPAQVMVAAELATGKRWQSAYTNTRPDGVPERCLVNYHVVGVETIEVPAGRFDTYRIQWDGEALGPNNRTRLLHTHWVDPATMWHVRKHDHMQDRAGVDILRETIELTALRRAPRN